MAQMPNDPRHHSERATEVGDARPVGCCRLPVCNSCLSVTQTGIGWRSEVEAMGLPGGDVVVLVEPVRVQ